MQHMGNGPCQHRLQSTRSQRSKFTRKLFSTLPMTSTGLSDAISDLDNIETVRRKGNCWFWNFQGENNTKLLIDRPIKDGSKDQ